MSRPVIDTQCVLAHWDGEDEQTAEFSAGGVGGYITVHEMPGGEVLVTLFRLHPKVRVRVQQGHLTRAGMDITH
jgi:hypothetical protein